MGAPEGVVLDDPLNFSVGVHDPDTGALVDAVPNFRIYNHATGALVFSGTMTKLGGPTTTGFYFASVLCTAANGFEIATAYSLCIEATVGPVTGGLAYGFTVYERVPEALGIPITIQGYDAVSGKPIQIVGRYR